MAGGGAWKVAYADFVTAMMAFFMVMWLMGSDDATKAAVSHYFNHPNTPYHEGRDPNSQAANPLGEEVGQFDLVGRRQGRHREGRVVETTGFFRLAAVEVAQGFAVGTDGDWCCRRLSAYMIEGLDRHHRLLDSYRKLHKARASVAGAGS